MSFQLLRHLNVTALLVHYSHFAQQIRGYLDHVQQPKLVDAAVEAVEVPRWFWKLPKFPVMLIIAFPKVLIAGIISRKR